VITALQECGVDVPSDLSISVCAVNGDGHALQQPILQGVVASSEHVLSLSPMTVQQLLDGGELPVCAMLLTTAEL